MKPQTIKRMRHASKNLFDGTARDPSEGVPIADAMETRSHMDAGTRDKVQLVLSKGGVPVAAIYITNADLKKLSRELGWWKNFRSGAAMASAHGNVIYGKE